MLAEVIALSNGHFRYDGPMFSGFGRQHRAFRLCQQDSIYVLLVTQREQPFDTAFSQTLGLDPYQMRYIRVKSTTHFHAGFAS